MKHWLTAGVLLATLAPAAALADDVESLHILNMNFEYRHGLMLQVHARGRTFEDLNHYNQFRGGPILFWQAKPRFWGIGGYYFINQNRRGVYTTYNVHRPFAGAQYRLIAGELWLLDARQLVERFHRSGGEDYWRMRHRWMLTREARFGEPYASAEAIREHRSWYGRYTAGVLWRVHPRLKVGTGYEFRQALTGPPSHVVATLFEWQARPLNRRRRN